MMNNINNFLPIYVSFADKIKQECPNMWENSRIQLAIETNGKREFDFVQACVKETVFLFKKLHKDSSSLIEEERLMFYHVNEFLDSIHLKDYSLEKMAEIIN